MLPAILCLLLAPQSAQQKPPGEQPGPVFRAETNLALVRFHVVRKNKFVEDLRAQDIHLLEDGVPQKVALFEGPHSGPAGRRTIPVEVILLFDVSLSVMNASLLDVLSIKETLLDGLGERVSVSIYAFAARLKRFCRPTRDPGKLKEALDGVYLFEHRGTRLFEAIMETARDASGSGANATRLMLILSDGFSTTKTPPENAAKAASVLGIPLYPVVLGHERVMKQAMSGGGQDPWAAGRRGAAGQARQVQREARARDKEAQMAEFAAIGPSTGGRSFDPPALSNIMIRQILASLVAQVQTEYVAGYYPPSAGETRRPHQVRVKLREPGSGKIYGGVRTVVH